MLFRDIIRRDLKLSIRRSTDVLTGLIFFLLIALIFPLAAGTERDLLLKMVGPVMLISALLASMMSIQNIFKPDYINGYLEQMMITTNSFSALIAVKIMMFWMIFSMPLIVIASFIASTYYVTGFSIFTVVLTLLLSTLSLVNLSAFAASLTLAIRYPGALISLIVIPLSLPIIIFGSKAIEYSILSMDNSGPLYFLTGMMFFTCSLGPLVTASAIKISID
ncbi:MAG: heme exporter protein CcmB [Gammaproteobacteria bacterium]|jgi:heme exporter protein B|nr:heme exporter protein CcmB [Gammaproteobacteria bacterium]|tara:strand:- start:1696 stop:2358 length:663 start_codon:yes stop_codon:yes gene_type:complete